MLGTLPGAHIDRRNVTLHPDVERHRQAARQREKGRHQEVDGTTAGHAPWSKIPQVREKNPGIVVTRNPNPGRMEKKLRSGGPAAARGPAGPVRGPDRHLRAAVTSRRRRSSPCSSQLTTGVWTHGSSWQLGTYPFIGYRVPGLGFLIELLILYMFGKDVFFGLYRRHFWRLILSAVGSAGGGGGGPPAPGRSPGQMPDRGGVGTIMQGQRMLLGDLHRRLRHGAPGTRRSTSSSSCRSRRAGCSWWRPCSP